MSRTVIKRVILLLIALLGFLPLLYVGRFQPSSAVKVPEGAVRLLYSVPVNPSQRAAYEQMFRIFNREHPGIHVTFDPVVADRYEARLQTQMLAGQAPDMFFFQNEIYPEWARDQLFYDLTDFANNDPDFNNDDFFPQCMEEAWLDGRLYGLPFQCGASVIFYNKELFEECGVNYSDETWDWNTFLDAAQKLTRDRNGDGRIDVFGVQMVDVSEWTFPFIWMKGGEILSPDKSRCVINSPESISALKWLTDIWNVHKVQVDSFVGAGGEAITSLGDPFVDGRIGMKFSGPYYCENLRLATKYHWGIAYFPRNPDTGLRWSRFYQDFMCVSARTKHPEECWQVLKYITGPVGQRMFAKSGSIPSRKSIAYSPAFVRDDTPWDETRLVDAIAHAHIQPVGRDYFWLRHEADMVFERMISKDARNRLPVDQGLKELEDRINRRFMEKPIAAAP